jgi:hypothetical protein
MKENLIKLRNTMNLIETKGESTKIMAQCLQYMEQLIVECDKPEPAPEPKAE